MTSVDRTAYPRFGRLVPGRDLADAFTPTDAETEWARSRTQDPEHLLALAVLLKSYQRLGYFPKLDDVPTVVVRHVRGCLGLGPDVEFGPAAERTGKRHREFVRARMKVTYDSARVREVAEQAIRKAVQAKDNPADLINVALEELVRARCELPGYTTLDAMAAAVRAEVNAAFYQTVAGQIGPMARLRLGRLYVVDPVTRRSGFDRLKDVAKSASLGKFRLRLDLLAEIDALGPTGEWLERVPSGKIAHFAGEARVTDVADLRKIQDEGKRLTLVASLVHVVRAVVRDDVVTMFCKRMAAIHKKGRDHLEALREAHRAESERLLGVLGDVLSAVREATADGGGQGPAAAEDAGEETGRLVLKTLERAGGVEALSAAHEAVSAHHGNNYLPLLDRHYRSHRSALFTLVDAIELESTSAERSVVDAVVYLRELRNAKASYVPERMDAGRLNANGEAETVTVAVDVDAFASAAWRKILRDKDHPGMLVRRHLEVCVFSYLAAELRSGDIAVAGSDSYANLHDQLMSWEECRPLALVFCAQAGIPSDPAALTAHYRFLLASTAARVDAGYPSNTDLALEGDRPVLRRRKGLDRRSEALRLEAAIHDRLPQRALLDILTRTAYLLGWHHHFGPASGSDPKIRDALARYVLTTFAYGTLLGPAQVAAHMRGKVSVHELTLAGNKHATAAKIEKASATVINAFGKLDVTAVWGDGKTAAADGSQIDTWEDNLLAETSVRYGGYGGIAYRHISNTYIALFSHFIPCGVWEAVYIIEGLLKNDSDVQPDTIHAGTQGHLVTWTPRAPLVGQAGGHRGCRAERSRGCRCGSISSARAMVHQGPATQRGRGAGGGGLGIPAVPGSPRLLAEHPGVVRVRPAAPVALPRRAGPDLGPVRPAALDRAAGIPAVGAVPPAAAAHDAVGGHARRERARDEAGGLHGEPDPGGDLVVLRVRDPVRHVGSGQSAGEAPRSGAGPGLRAAPAVHGPGQPSAAHPPRGARQDGPAPPAPAG